MSIGWCLPSKSAPPTGVPAHGNEDLISVWDNFFDQFYLYAAVVGGGSATWHWTWVPLDMYDSDAPDITHPTADVARCDFFNYYGPQTQLNHKGTLTLWADDHPETLTAALMYGVGAYGDLVLTSEGGDVEVIVLPEVLPPFDLPFRAPGHGFADDAVYADVGVATGHGRKRRLFTASERSVDVSWLLGTAHAALVDTWFEDTLAAGSAYFSIQVQGQDSLDLLWWKARWLTPLTFEPRAGDVWLVSGTLKLFGSGSAAAPATTPLGCELRLPLYGNAELVVATSLGCEIALPLEGHETLGALNFPVALL